MRNRFSLDLLLLGLLGLLCGCGELQKQREYVGIPGDAVRTLAAKVLTEGGYTLERTEFKDFTVVATSKKLPARGGLEWHEIIVTAREYPVSPAKVELLVQVRIWRQPPIGDKEMLVNTFREERMAGEKALERLDQLPESVSISAAD